jgi:hypothetical protein
MKTRNRPEIEKSGKPPGIRCSLGWFIAIMVCALHCFAEVAVGLDSPAWKYPGVPYTDWEYDPFTHAAPGTPAEWPAAGKAGYYRIEKDNPAATDVVLAGEPVDTNGKRYGYPDRPRATFPLISKNANWFPPGVVFWIKGGEHNTIYGTGEVLCISSESTPDAPFWIYGDPTDRPKFNNARITLFNASYGFVENIDWDTTSKGSGCIEFASPFGEGPTHHVAVRNCTFQNRNYVSNGAMLSIVSRGEEVADGAIHDIVCYKLLFKNNGGGINWDSLDADFHAYKIDGTYKLNQADGVAISQNRVYRVWVIENIVLPGDTPDPVDGRKKGLVGDFVQTGDQKLHLGNVDHVYVAGNHVEGTRQSGVGPKRSGHIVVSSNVVKNIVQSATSQGQAFNVKYDRQENIWFVNNYVEYVDAFIIRAETTAGYGVEKDTFNKLDTRVYIVGNIFKDCMREPWEAPDLGGIGGRKSKGICVQDFNGKVYVMNNVVDGSPYGAYFGTSGTRQSVGSEMHVYNNVFLNLAAGPDTSAAANNGICVITATDTKWYMENNFTENGRNYFATNQYTTDAAFNARPDASGNLSGDPLFKDAANDDYTPKTGSPLIGTGVKVSTTTPAPVDLYQLFIDAFANDPDFPGNPADVWPRDFAGNSRFVDGKIDRGAYAFGSSPVEPGGSNRGRRLTAPRGLNAAPAR